MRGVRFQVEQWPPGTHPVPDVGPKRTPVARRERHPLGRAVHHRVEHPAAEAARLTSGVDVQVGQEPPIGPAESDGACHAGDRPVELAHDQPQVGPGEQVLDVRRTLHARPRDRLVVGLEDGGDRGQIRACRRPDVHRPASRITSTNRSWGRACAVIPSRPTTVGAETSALTIASSVASITASNSSSTTMSPATRTS